MTCSLLINFDVIRCRILLLVVNGEEVSVNEADYLSSNLLATGPSKRWRGRGVGVVL